MITFFLNRSNGVLKIPSPKKSFAQNTDFFGSFLLPRSPLAIFERKKSFHLLEGTMNTFWELEKVKTMQETAQYFERRFL
jgi:hypothetical protein